MLKFNFYDKVKYVSEEKGFITFCSHYKRELTDLYKIFRNTCKENNVDWYNTITFQKFCEYTYWNSSKDLY